MVAEGGTEVGPVLEGLVGEEDQEEVCMVYVSDYFLMHVCVVAYMIPETYQCQCSRIHIPPPPPNVWV